METADDSLRLSSSAGTAIEATRSSFERVWNGVIATGGGFLFTNSFVKGTVTNTTPSGRQTYYTGGIEYQLTKNKRLVPYATAAVGAARRSGSLRKNATGAISSCIWSAGPLGTGQSKRAFPRKRRNPRRIWGRDPGLPVSVGDSGVGCAFISAAVRSARWLMPRRRPCRSPAFAISRRQPALVFSTGRARQPVGARRDGPDAFTGSGAIRRA
jgi:hypothetical protein